MSRDDMIAALQMVIDESWQDGPDHKRMRRDLAAVLAALRATPEGTPQTAAPVTREQLRFIEWRSWAEDTARSCPACGHDQDEGHSPGCWLAAALSAAPPPPAGYTPETWARFCALSAAPPADETLVVHDGGAYDADWTVPKPAVAVSVAAPVPTPRHPVFSLENAFDHENNCPAPDYKGTCTCPPAPMTGKTGNENQFRGTTEMVAAPAPTPPETKGRDDDPVRCSHSDVGADTHGGGGVVAGTLTVELESLRLVNLSLRADASNVALALETERKAIARAEAAEKALDALAAPAPTPQTENICQCGHLREQHGAGDSPPCLVAGCGCKYFVLVVSRPMKDSPRLIDAVLADLHGTIASMPTQRLSGGKTLYVQRSTVLNSVEAAIEKRLASPAPTGAPADLVALVEQMKRTHDAADANPSVATLTAQMKAYVAVLAWHPAAPAPPPAYDKTFGDDRECACGHPYYRHFDSYDNMRPVGCKYCGCAQWAALPPVEADK